MFLAKSTSSMLALADSASWTRISAAMESPLDAIEFAALVDSPKLTAISDSRRCAASQKYSQPLMAASDFYPSEQMLCQQGDSTALLHNALGQRIICERGRRANRYTLAPELLTHLDRQRSAAAHAGR